MSNTLISWAEAIASYLLIGFVAAAILVPLAWGIIKAVGIRKPVYRHMIWLYSLVGIVMLPAIWLYGPKLTLAIIPASIESPVVVNPGPVRSGGPVVSGSEAYSPQAAFDIDLLSEMTIQRSFPIFKVTLAGVWFSGFVLMLLRLVVGWCSLHRICSMATHLSEKACLVDTHNHRLRIRLTSHIPGPVCFGIFRPVILRWRQNRRMPQPPSIDDSK